MDGTASLANRDFGSRLRTSRRKIVFSGAARHANEAAGAGYSVDSGGEFAETGLGGGAGANLNRRDPGCAPALRWLNESL
jgi:hypothetical protein